MRLRRLRPGLLSVSVSVAAAVGCGGGSATQPAERTSAPGLVARPDFPARRVARAGADFTRTWSDGRAELSGYHGVVPRYGHLREAEVVLIYVTEPMDRRTWIKDDEARGADRVEVLKLNASLTFLTGIYPYSVMTSVFAPLDDWGLGERFQPVKITLTAQEWCGHVFHGLWPGRDRAESQIASYFASEGEAQATIETPPGTLYEDALLVQLRELDGPFAGGREWRGPLVPSLWGTRRAHVALAPAPAVITRAEAELDGVPVTRFVVTRGDLRRTFDVERAAPRRVLAIASSDGESLRLAGTARLPYWELNDPGEERYREQLGLPARPAVVEPPAPPGTAAIGR